jgi:hypothetical protein
MTIIRILEMADGTYSEETDKRTRAPHRNTRETPDPKPIPPADPPPPTPKPPEQPTPPESPTPPETPKTP